MWQIFAEVAAFVGALTGVPALLWQFHEKRIRIRLEVKVGDSVDTTNGCVWITAYNDGPPILVDRIVVQHTGEFPPDWPKFPSSEFTPEYRAPARREEALELRTGDHTDAFIPFEWQQFNKANLKWGVALKLRNGRSWNVPSEFIAKGEIKDFLIRPVFLGIIGPCRLTRRRATRKSRRAWKKLITESKIHNTAEVHPKAVAPHAASGLSTDG